MMMLTKIEDKRWEVVYENVYGRWSFRENLKKLDFFSIMGNHDHRGNQTAQLMYAQVCFQHAVWINRISLLKFSID